MDFQKVYNRKETSSVKWDNLSEVFQTDNVIPLWIADMDFKAPNEVNDAIIERAKHGIYGYTMVTDETKHLVTNWLSNRHDWHVNINMLTFSPNVIMGLHYAIQSFTEKNDKIIIQTPVYTPFFNLIKNNGRKIVENPLHYENNTYSINFELFEKQLKQGVKAFIMCSPHNPVGRVWKKSELSKIAELCLKYKVLIFADEIHADLIFSGNQHIPIASLSEEVAQQTITFMSPTKTFNLAGLQASYMVIFDKEKQRIMQQALSNSGAGMLNTMGLTALESAYKYGENWLNELMEVINLNKDIVIKAMNDKLKDKLAIVASEGTYLLWIDCHRLQMDDDQLQQFMVEEAKVGLNRGISYGEDGSQFMRMNIACPTKTIEEAMDQIVTAINQLD